MKASKRAAALRLLALAALGCGSTSRALPEPTKSGCVTDADCRDGFCDRTGRCGAVDPARTGRFGTACMLAERNPNGTVYGELNTCGPYPCVDGRCRSCLEDAECVTEMGAPTCAQAPEPARWPGNSCGNYQSTASSAPIPRAVPPSTEPAAVERLAVQVVRTFPHSAHAFTEGLVFHGGELLESTGNTGSSQLRRLDLQTGEAIAVVDLERSLFGEGLAVSADRLVQLTLSSERALIWDRASLEPVGELAYQGEGWGLCHDGKRFVMSDGTDTLQLRDTESFAPLGTVKVRSRAATQFAALRLNELECVDGNVFANVFRYRELVRIDMTTGEITAIVDTRNLLQHADVPPASVDQALDLNGVAYVAETGHFLLTGKYWPRVFEVRLVKDELFR
jgi:glutaminyl-peptide cyclotransferase